MSPPLHPIPHHWGHGLGPASDGAFTGSHSKRSRLGRARVLLKEGGDGCGSRSSVSELWERPRRVHVPVGVQPVGEPGRGPEGSGGGEAYLWRNEGTRHG